MVIFYLTEQHNIYGNVLAVVSDKRLPNDEPDVVSVSDYYPYGMLMPDRSYDAEEYRYGFGGYEKDDEVSGEGNHLSFGDYGYDPRLGRRWDVDPQAKKYPSYSPYIYCTDNPLLFFDNEGEEPITAVIDAITAFAVEAGMSYVENILLNDMDATTAFENIRWKDAGIEATKSYALSLFITGVGSTKALAKIANSKIGKITTEFVANMVANLMKSYNNGDFNDINGDFNFGKFLNFKFKSIMQEAVIDALVSQGFSEKANKLSKELDDIQSDIAKQESKLIRSINNGVSEEIIKNREKKVNNAQKELLKTIGESSVMSTSKEVIAKGIINQMSRNEK